MRPESVTLLTDILEAGERIGIYTRDNSRESFLAGEQIRDAVTLQAGRHVHGKVVVTL